MQRLRLFLCAGLLAACETRDPVDADAGGGAARGTRLLIATGSEVALFDLDEPNRELIRRGTVASDAIAVAGALSAEPPRGNKKGGAAARTAVSQAWFLRKLGQEREGRSAGALGLMRPIRFYDVWLLATRFAFDGAVLAKAIAATFKNRETAVDVAPIAFTPEFTEQVSTLAQWTAFRKKLPSSDCPEKLSDLVPFLAGFLLPIARACESGASFERRWRAGGPWTPER